MSNIKKITVLQFRNYASSSFEFPSLITCITGANGTGKTNLLDAVYYMCYTKSYFSAYQQNSAMTGTDGFRVTGTMVREGTEENISCKWQSGKKEVTTNGSVYDKVTDHIGRYSAVIIAPDDTELINGGSEGRRKWIDSILSQTDKTYFEYLLHYQQVLLQRNAWLKMKYYKPSSDHTELEYYDRQLAADSDYIFRQRIKFLETLTPLLNDLYYRLSGNKETIKVTYQSDMHERPLAEWLQQHLEHDLRMQRTLKGIHKDDLDLTSNEMLVKNFGSQGQKKSFLFALKLAQYAYLTSTQGHKPILLLDDIFEKLDQSRIEALLAIITEDSFGQVLLTDTHQERIGQAFKKGTDIGYIVLK